MREELMVGVKIGAAFSLLETQTASFTKQTGEKQREKNTLKLTSCLHRGLFAVILHLACQRCFIIDEWYVFSLRFCKIHFAKQIIRKHSCLLKHAGLHS